MKHIQLFESFLNEKMLKKDLKKLADEIAAQIPSLPAFTKFKSGAAKIAMDEDLVLHDMPDAPKLSSIGTFRENFIKLNRNQSSYIALYDNTGNQLFRIVYVINHKSSGLYGDGAVWVDRFQIIIGDTYKSISPEMEMIILNTYLDDAAEDFKNHLNKALNSPGFVQLIKQYAEAIKEFNS